MSTALNPSFTTPSQHFARQRIESRINLPRLFAAIDADPGIVGAGVVYIDGDFNVITLREFRPICSRAVKRVILREAVRHTTPDQFTKLVQSNRRESQVLQEALNAGLSCTGAVLSWVVMFSGTIAVPFTAGASSVIAFIGYSAATASGLQCLAGAGRVAVSAYNPQVLDELDSNEWYQAVSLVLDGVSLAGVGASALTTARLIAMTKASTGKSLRVALQGLNRQERKRLTEELLALKDPKLTPKLLKLKQASGELTKRYTPTQFRHATITQIRDSISASLGVIGSSMSGNINVAVGLYEEQPE
ncbi:NAD synthetase [Pseudomonas putida]